MSSLLSVILAAVRGPILRSRVMPRGGRGPAVPTVGGGPHNKIRNTPYS